MNIKDSIDESEPCVLVEGPTWGDADFYGKWLRAAAKAERLLEKAIKDPRFKNQFERLLVVQIPIAATVLLSRLERNLVSLVVRVNGEEAEEFVVMAEMGFFALTGQRYQMTIPTRLDIDKVKSAILKVVRTEDEKYYLHPEYLVATMPYAEAEAWQHRLREMDQASRHADRLLLLE